MPPVIFVTAYDEYAVKAFELNAVDYLLKPFDEERLRRSIERARARISSQKEGALSEQLQALARVEGEALPGADNRKKRRASRFCARVLD